jgi:hypothetical protein
MARTFIRQDTQIRKSDVYDDTIAPTLADYETNPVSIEDDLNSVRSQLNNFLDLQAGNWYDDIATPATFEGGAQRGIDGLNQDLHDFEHKRVLRGVCNLTDIGPLGSVQGVILGAGELPANTTAAIGAVTTLGTVCATATVFGTFSATDIVAGSNAVSPKNMCEIVDGTTRDPILDASGRRVWGLFQSESAVDGSTLTAVTPDRAQISFVVVNATGDGLQLVAAADMNGKTINYCSVERVYMLTLNEQDFLRGAVLDTPGSAVVTRQTAYDGQGVTPVDVTTNSYLDLEGAGLVWVIRDDLEAALFTVTEGSAGGTSTIQIGADVDTFDVNAAVNDFANGITVDSGGTALDIGATSPGVITSAGLLTLESTGADLKLDSGAQLVFTDQWQAGSGYATDLVLSDASAEWDLFETNFGEVSLINAINQAYEHGARGTKTYANVTATTPVDTDVGGVGGGANLDAQLPDMSLGNFLTDYDVFVNGVLKRPGADAAANNDYYPGTSLANGQLKFEFVVVVNDVICVIPYA